MLAFLLAASILSAPLVPNPTLTPGAVNTEITQSNIQTTICVKGYTAKPGVRNVTEQTKKLVYKEYNYDPKTLGPAEVDHLISLELGGSNDIKNLWPQSYTTTPYNARIKDGIENTLHAMVCKGEIPLTQAQHEIATDWPSAYKKYVLSRH